MAALIAGTAMIYEKAKEARKRQKAEKADARVDALTHPTDDDLGHRPTDAGASSTVKKSESSNQEGDTGLEGNSELERNRGLERNGSENMVDEPKNRESYDRPLVTGEKEGAGKRRWMGLGRKKDKDDAIIR